MRLNLDSNPIDLLIESIIYECYFMHLITNSLLFLTATEYSHPFLQAA